MPKIRLPEEMTKEEIVAEYMKMRELLDQSAKKTVKLEHNTKRKTQSINQI